MFKLGQLLKANSSIICKSSLKITISKFKQSVNAPSLILITFWLSIMLGMTTLVALPIYFSIITPLSSSLYEKIDKSLHFSHWAYSVNLFALSNRVCAAFEPIPTRMPLPSGRVLYDDRVYPSRFKYQEPLTVIGLIKPNCSIVSIIKLGSPSIVSPRLHHS